MRRAVYLGIGIIVVILVLAFLPLDPLGVTTPGVGPTIVGPTCSSQSAGGNVSYSNCTFIASEYRGYASLSYCFLGSGGLWLNGSYYAWTHPSDSRGFEVSSLCPELGVP